MLLTKKIHDILDHEIITVEHLKKVKEGYTDQFSLDFQLLMKECQCLERPPKLDLNSRPVIKQINKSTQPKSDAKIRHQRMKDYAFKNSLFQREPIEINKPNQKKDDFTNIKIVDRNLYGKQVAAIQHSVMDTVKQMQDFHHARET